MRFLVVGCGSIGERHVRNLLALGHEVLGFEPDRRRAAEVAGRYRIEVTSDLDVALAGRPDGALVCAPTSEHLPLSFKVAEAGVNLFVEKPLANDLEGIEGLIALAEEKGIVTLVGCNTRFLPSFERVKRLLDQGAIGRVLSVEAEFGFYLPYWHPWEDYRQGYSASRSLGGGIILDDIHEIDALDYMLGPVASVYCVASTVSGLEIDTEDLAEITLRYESGPIAHVHLDYIQRTYRRWHKYIGERGEVVWDYVAGRVELFGEEAYSWTAWQDGVSASHEEMFLGELRHFAACIAGEQRSINDLRSATRIMKVALACHSSAEQGVAVRP